MYLPYQQVRNGWYPPYVPQDLAIRTVQGDAAQIAPAVRRIIASAEPQLPVTKRPLAGRYRGRVAEGATASLRPDSQVIAFLLAAIDIHGLLAYAVSQRTQEIGVRVALGATRGNILRLVVGDAMLLSFIAL